MVDRALSPVMRIVKKYMPLTSKLLSGQNLFKQVRMMFWVVRPPLNYFEAAWRYNPRCLR